MLGKIAAAQIKSGESWFRDKGDHWAFYPEVKHKAYCECFPVPVYLFLHNPKSDITYYCDARYYLNIPEREKTYLYIPIHKANRLDLVSSENVFIPSGLMSCNLLPYSELLNTMAQLSTDNASLPLTYLDLFCNGLTNVCRHIYFSMHLVEEVAEFYLGLDQSNVGIGIGPSEHDFLHNYTRFLISQNLAKIDYSDYLIDWNKRQMQPEYLVPLTSRGRSFLEYICEVEKDLFQDSEQLIVACERPIGMLFGLPSDLVRIPKIREFGRRILSDV